MRNAYRTPLGETQILLHASLLPSVERSKQSGSNPPPPLRGPRSAQRRSQGKFPPTHRITYTLRKSTCVRKGKHVSPQSVVRSTGRKPIGKGYTHRNKVGASLSQTGTRHRMHLQRNHQPTDRWFQHRDRDRDRDEAKRPCVNAVGKHS